MILLLRPILLLAITAVSFLTIGRAPGAVVLRTRDLDRLVVGSQQAN